MGVTPSGLGAVPSHDDDPDQFPDESREPYSKFTSVTSSTIVSPASLLWSMEDGSVWSSAVTQGRSCRHNPPFWPSQYDTRHRSLGACAFVSGGMIRPVPLVNSPGTRLR